MKWSEIKGLQKNFGPQGIGNHLPVFVKIVFLPFLAAILNFWECKNAAISEMVRDRMILTEVLAPRVWALISGTFCQKSFSHHF